MKSLMRQRALISAVIIILTLWNVSAGIVHAAPARPSQPLRRPQAAATGVSVPGSTYSGLSAVPCDLGYQDVYYAYTGTDGHLNVVHQSIEPNPGGGTYTWSLTTTVSDTSDFQPSITCWNSKIWVAFKDAGSTAIHVGDFTDRTQSCGTCLPQLAHGTTIPNQGAAGPPAIVGNGGTLYVAWKGTTSTHLVVEESVTSGATWVDHTVITSDTTSIEPSLTVYNGNVIMAWGGTDSPSHLNFATYQDNNPTLQQRHTHLDTLAYLTVDDTIGLSTYNGRIQFAFRYPAPQNPIYTGSWSSSTGYLSNGNLGVDTLYGIGLAGLNVYFNNADVVAITLVIMP